MRKLNFNNRSKENIRRIKRYYRRKVPNAYTEEKNMYEQVLADIKDLAKELNKVCKGYGDKVLAKAENRADALHNPKSLIASSIKKESARLPKNRVKTAQYLKSVRSNIAELTREPQYNPDNLKNYITVIAAKASGIKTKRSNRTGQIKPDLKTATSDQKKAYKKVRRFVKSGGADIILRAMGAYEKSYGNRGKVANSSEVMENITVYVQEHPDSTIDDIITKVHKAIS